MVSSGSFNSRLKIDSYCARALPFWKSVRAVRGVKMRIDRLDQLEFEFAEQLAIAIDPLQHGIEDHRFAARAACQEIAVGAGDAVEQLTKDHGDEIREPIHLWSHAINRSAARQKEPIPAPKC